MGEAIIEGDGQDAVTVAGASPVHHNLASGIIIETGSSVVFSEVVSADNGLHGIDVSTGSVARVNGALDATANRVFGINVNGSSFTLSEAEVSATGNVLGIQIGTGANAFIGDADSVINANNNLATGLTIVSGSHLVSFGGTINATGNAGVGVSVNSKSGLDLDAGSMLNSTGNGDGVLVQQNSVMTVFNTPQFSGAPGFSTISARDNTRSGVRVLNDAVLTLVNQARVVSAGNGTIGFVADNGAGATLVNSTITGNAVSDIQLTFGARADLRTLTFGNYACDGSVLVRGTSGIVCPH